MSPITLLCIFTLLGFNGGIICEEVTQAPSHEGLSLLLTNDSAVRHMFTCFLDEGPCDEVSSSLKGFVTILVTDSCDGCDDEDKEFLDHTSQHLRQNYPLLWARLVRKYTPELPEVTTEAPRTLRVSNGSHFVPSLFSVFSIMSSLM